MKRIHFVVTDSLYQKIEEAMRRLGIHVKSDFFRMLILQCVKENTILPKPPETNHVPIVDLTPDEKVIIDALKTESKSIDDLVNDTKLSLSKVSSLLTYLLLKNHITQEGRYFKIQLPNTSARDL